MTASLGAPLERTTNAECALDVVAFDGGLLVNVQKGRFVGWTVRATEGRALGTMSGIGLGSTRSALEGAYAATVRKSTIGEEFSAGGLSGLLSSDAPQATITDLWAGINCIAR